MEKFCYIKANLTEKNAQVDLIFVPELSRVKKIKDVLVVLLD